MGILEEGFEKLHWPPLVRNVVLTAYAPGYRYEFFKSFRELDEYFTQEIGPDWRKEEWAAYWMNQHLETKREDRKDADPRQRKSTGPRRDTKIIYARCVEYLKENPDVSSRKLTAHLKTIGITITNPTAWRIIKIYKELQQEKQDA